MSAPGVLAASMLLVGCLSPAVPREAPGPTLDLAFDHDASGCIEVLLGVLADPAHLRRFLPEGIEPLDAGAAIPTALPTGRGLATLNAVSCEASDLEGDRVGFADLLIPIEAPAVKGMESPPAERHGYLVEMHTSRASFINATRPLGLAVSLAEVSVAVQTPGAGALGAGAITNQAGPLARFEVAAAGGSPETAGANQYQATTSGLAVNALAWEEAPVRLGTVTSCAIRAGTLAAEVLGTTTCRDVEAIGAVFGPFSPEQRFHHHGNATLEGG